MAVKLRLIRMGAKKEVILCICWITLLAEKLRHGS